jgi:hypothetical protein
MRSLGISVIIAVAIPLAGTTIASAMPVDGAAIARLGQQVNAVLDVRAKKAKRPRTRTSAPTPPPAPRQPGETY